MKSIVQRVFLSVGFLFSVSLAVGLDIHDAVHSYSSLSDTTVTMTGRSELRLTSSTTPLTNCQVNLNSDDAWLFLLGLRPSAVNSSTYLSQIHVNGMQAALDVNIRVVRYGNGTVVIPHGPEYQPLEVFNGVHFTGSPMSLGLYTYYRPQQLSAMNNAISSFRLKRGYMATFAQESDGTGISQVFIADDKDLEIGIMPPQLDNAVSFVRVFPWRWVTQKGWAGGDRNQAGTLHASWNYDWDNASNSTLDIEYVPMRHNRWWNSYSNINNKQNVTHVLGFNEPDRPDQADMSVAQAIAEWPNLLASGLRLGSPAPAESGLWWLYDFIDQADARNYRVDFVAVHFYGNNWSSSQLYNWLRDIHRRTKRPLWITEWNNGCNWTSPHPTSEQNAAKISEHLTMLAGAPFVERYSIYQWCTNRELFSYNDGSITATGRAYRDHVSPMSMALDPNRECIGYYRLDELAGVTAQDLSGRKRHGALENGLTFDEGSVPGVLGQALRFDGVDDYIELPQGYGALDNGFSVTLWARPTAVKSWARFIDFGRGDHNHNIILGRRSTSNDLIFSVYNGSEWTYRTATNAIENDQWQFFAATVDFRGSAVLYKNGQAVASGTIARPATINRTRNYIGRSNWSADDYYQGDMDDIRFFNYPLSYGEIQAIYNAPVVAEPFDGSPAPVPGRIQAERFDLGGMGISYHDMTFGNSGGAFRPHENVDIRTINDNGNGYAVTDIAPSEWLKYTVRVAQSDTYCLYLRASSVLDETCVVFRQESEPAFEAVGVYDEQTVQLNAANFNMGYSSNSTWTTGIGQTLEAAQILTVEQFKPMVEAAFSEGRGGVINFDNMELSNSNSFDVSFDGGSKKFTIISQSGTIQTAGPSGNRTAISGQTYLSTGVTPHFYFDFDNFRGMGADRITAVGVTLLGRNGTGGTSNWRVSANYTNGLETGSSSTFRTINTNSGNGTQDSFSGIIAPEGFWITGLRIHSDQHVYTSIDDLAFVFSDSVLAAVQAFDSGSEIGQITVTNTGSADMFQTFVLNDVQLAEGDQQLVLEFPIGELDVNWFQFVKPGPYGDQPMTVPCRIQAEEYDIGGPGRAYHDTTIGNQSGSFRYYENVDVIGIVDAVDGYAVDNIESGEWLVYTVNSIAAQGDIYARVASMQAGGQIFVWLDDDLLATINVPDTGSLTTWKTISAPCLPLPDRDNAKLMLEFVGTGFRLNWIDFRNRMPYPHGVPHAIPGRIGFEDYDIGAQHISYFDNTAFNAYSKDYRLVEGEYVDIAAINDGMPGYAVYAAASPSPEWLEYTCEIAPGTYTVVVRHASGFAPQQLMLSVGTETLATFALPNTGWGFQETTIPDVVLPGGEQVLRFTLNQGTVLLNYVDFIRQYHPADLTQSGRVDMDDFAILAAQWLGVPGQPSADIAPQPDGDGVVDLLDVLMLADNWLFLE